MAALSISIRALAMAALADSVQWQITIRTSQIPMLIVDAHLDLAYNALYGREVLLPAAQQTPGNVQEDGFPSVGLPDLRRGSVGLICATIFCEPDEGKGKGYRTGDQANAEARRQLEWYHQQFAAGEMKLVRTASDLPTKPAKPISTIILMEGADPLRSEADVEWFAQLGVRLVGLAWKRTCHAGGTGTPGPLTDDGRQMVGILDRYEIIHDTSHLAEESFWNLLELSDGPIMASHSNCRAFNPTDRQLSDEMIKAIVQRGGMIGMNFYDKFLVPPEEFRKRKANLHDLLKHIRHVCDIAGNVNHVAIGTDMDGGFGRDEIPEEIPSAGELPRLAEFLGNHGFTAQEVEGIMGGNWLRFFRENLP
jgi:membrane dipeptidase